MNIHKIAIILLLSACTIGLANQINMKNVRIVTVPVKSEVTRQDENEEQDLDVIIDFETEGELSEEDLAQPLWVVVANKIVSPFFVLYNWLQKKN